LLIGSALDIGLKMTINYNIEEYESLIPSGYLRETINHSLEEAIGLLLSGGLRKNTNQ
jgi:hypothetical protein